jgi:hypothetical protein
MASAASLWLTLAALGTVPTAFAASTSGSFALAQSTFGSAGQQAGSSSFVLDGSLAQESVIGNASSASYSLQSGFWTSASASYVVALQASGNGEGDMQGGGLACAASASGTSGACSQSIGQGNEISILAEADTNSDFDGWSGCDSLSTNVTTDDTCHLQVQTGTTLSAAFTLKQFTFSTATAGNGSGSTSGSSTDAVYDYGTEITLVANADPGSSFTGWSPAGCTDGLSLTEATTCTANFDLNTYAINTSVQPSGAGSLTCLPNPVTHGGNSSCSAEAAAGYLFDRFSGDCTGTICELTAVDAEKNISAHFIIEDGDGVPAEVENAAPNGGDGNADGIADAQQTHVTSLPSAVGGIYLTLEVNGACASAENVSAILPPTTDTQFNYPYGLLAFALPCETAQVTIYYHEATDLSGHAYRKYGPLPPGSPDSQWYSLPGALFGSVDLMGVATPFVSFSLADNQTGDDTGDDGVIVDAGGPGSAATAVPIPTLGAWPLALLTWLLGWVASRSYPRRM